MAELFQTTQQNISQHIVNIFEEGELTPETTHKKFLSVRREGKRNVRRELDYYNLDMIISVGYRIKSLVATRFRIWATQRLKEYLVKGFTMDDERLKNPPGYFLPVKREGWSDEPTLKNVRGGSALCTHLFHCPDTGPVLNRKISMLLLVSVS